MVLKALLVGLTVVVLGGCDRGGGAGTQPPGKAASPAAQPAADAETLALGARVYARNCARCHGPRAEGDFQWRRRTPEGRYRPPPLDGTGHAWHHPLDVLRRVIREGGPPGQSDMPAWGDRLSPQEIDAVIAWFQSRWPPEIRQAWERRNAASGRPR